MKRIFMVCVLVCMFASLAIGLPGTKQYQAVWDPNSEPDLAGYKMYWSKTQGVYNENDMVDVGNVTKQKVTGVVPIDSYITVTAYDLSGNESDFAVPFFFDKDILAPAGVGGIKLEEVK